MLNDFVEGLAEKNSNSNIGIYQIYSSFIGNESDEYIPQEEIILNRKDKEFYIIVMSENTTVYSDFTRKLEEEMSKANVDCSQKYELMNQVINPNFELKINKDDLLSIGFAENETLNMDNDSFNSLKENEIALRVVMGEEERNITLNAIAPLGREGDSSQTDTMEISVKSIISYPTGSKKYEEYKEEG